MNRRIYSVALSFLFFLLLASLPRHAWSADPDSPRLTVGLNVISPLVHGIAGTAADVTWFGLPLEANIRLSQRWGLSAEVFYRFEDYGRDSGIWNDYHEAFISAGPRLTLSRSGLEGWFASFKLGFGYAEDPSPYHCVSLVMQPKVGYALTWGSPGLYLSFGLGLLVNIPLDEDPWYGYERLTTIGLLAHRFFPMGDISVGFGMF